MDIFFQDPSAIPLPPNEVRIREFSAEPWPDQRRIRVNLEITPFQKRPNGEIKIFDPEGKEAALLTIIETIVSKMDFTVHLRTAPVFGLYTATASIYYMKQDEESGQDSAGDKEKLSLPTEMIVVDQAEAKFEIQE
jgi:hypothetical protein